MNILWFLRSGTHDAGADELNDALRRSRWVFWSIVLVVSVFLLWAHFARIDQITRAPGVVVSSARSQIIQSLDGGIIEDILVREGDKVKRGQLLVKIDATRQQSGYLEMRAKAAALASIVARLQAEVLGRDIRFPEVIRDYPEFRTNQVDLFNKRRAAIGEEVQALQAMMALTQKELDMTQPLLKTGDVSLTDVLRLQRQVADIQSQITNRKNKYFQDAQSELSKAQEDLASVEQVLAQRQDQLTQTELKAPMNGVVKNVRVSTRGGVLRPGDEVMQIVPIEEDLLIEAKVSPVDIAFIRTGQTAGIKIDAYDYTLFGTLSGKLVYISPDTLNENLNLQQGEQPYYRVRIQTTGRRFSGRPDEELDIQPGMTSTVEIKTGSHTVLHYLTKPILKTLDQALRER